MNDRSNTDLPTPESPSRDPFFRLIKVAIVLVVVWELLTPLVPRVALTAMERFHLRSSSFVVWAAQFPVPSMYNFSNRFEVRELPEGLIDAPLLFDPVVDESERRWVNHFPTRILTFANGRHKHLRFGKDRWMTLWSSYRGQTLETKIHAKHIEGGRFHWVREADE